MLLQQHLFGALLCLFASVSHALFVGSCAIVVQDAFGVCNVCRQLCNVWCISNWRVEQYTELCKKRLVFALFAMFANSTKHGARAD